MRPLFIGMGDQINIFNSKWLFCDFLNRHVCFNQNSDPKREANSFICRSVALALINFWKVPEICARSRGNHPQ